MGIRFLVGAAIRKSRLVGNRSDLLKPFAFMTFVHLPQIKRQTPRIKSFFSLCRHNGEIWGKTIRTILGEMTWGCALPPTVRRLTLPHIKQMGCRPMADAIKEKEIN